MRPGAHRCEAERPLLWANVVKGKPLSWLNILDCAEYFDQFQHYQQSFSLSRSQALGVPSSSWRRMK
ncbi:integrase [Burkholderia sp. SRS-46]|nr:integrase [Burkholderia sp. SRS-46]